MRHHLDPGRAEAVGLTITGHKGVDSVAVSITAEAILAAREGRGTSYSRTVGAYTGLTQYGGAAYTYSNTMRAIDHVAGLGLVNLQAGFWRSDGSGKRSTFTATAKLANLGDAAPRILVRQPSALVMKDATKSVVPYTPTRETTRLCHDLAAWTESVRGSDIRLDAPDIVWVPDGAVSIPHATKGGGPITVSVGEFALYRVYNNGSFLQGGRAYGHWSQSLPGERRRQIVIEGEPVALLDYSAAHPRLLYAKAGIPLDGDPYDIPGTDREMVKLALLVVLNATSPRQGVEAMAHKMAQNRTVTDADRMAARDLLASVQTRHAPIAAQFYRGSGLACQRIEADVLADVARISRKDGIVTLPVHDEMITAQRHGGRVRELMMRCWTERTGSDAVVK